MKLKHLFTLLLSAAFVFSLSACDGEENSSSSSSSPTSIDSSSESTNENENSDIACTFTVSVDTGVTAANVAFTLTSGASSYDLTSNANGVATAELPAGTYEISYNSDTLPSACTPDVYSVTVSETAAEFTLLLINNTPDGSANKPFLVTDNATALSLDAGEELYFRYRGESATLYVGSENVSVVYNGTTYTAFDGKVTVEIGAQDYMGTIFSIKNTSNATVETEMEFVYPLGSMNNPIVLSGDSATTTAEVAENGSVVYKWTATKNGVLTISTANTLAYISVTNPTAIAQPDDISGAGSTTVNCSAGDVILIIVGNNFEAVEAVDVEFTIAVA